MKHFNATHGESETRLYYIWTTMKARCLNKNNRNYPIYGGRGIMVCDEWLKSYESFRDWALKNGYEDNLTIDRKNNDDNYKPNNCRWANSFTQAQNKRKMKNNTSGFKGVSFRKDSEKWRARIHIEKETIQLGSFDYAYTAGYIYDSYVIRHNLEHIRNFK